MALALFASAWLAYATTSPKGDVGSSGGVTTTTARVSPSSTEQSTSTTVKSTTSTTMQSTTTTTIKQCPPVEEKDHGQKNGYGQVAANNSMRNDNCPPPVCKDDLGKGDDIHKNQDKNHCDNEHGDFFPPVPFWLSHFFKSFFGPILFWLS
jgi:hypothetical protein